MFKIAGSVLIIISTVYIFNINTAKNYFTYRFLKDVSIIVQKIKYEKNLNLSYTEIFNKINFNMEKYFNKYYNNQFINSNELDSIKKFFNNLGKRNYKSEEEFIKYNCEYISNRMDWYFERYTETRKIYLITGLSFGLFIVIILI